MKNERTAKGTAEALLGMHAEAQKQKAFSDMPWHCRRIMCQWLLLGDRKLVRLLSIVRGKWAVYQDCHLQGAKQ